MEPLTTGDRRLKSMCVSQSNHIFDFGVHNPCRTYANVVVSMYVALNAEMFPWPKPSRAIVVMRERKVEGVTSGGHTRRRFGREVQKPDAHLVTAIVWISS